MKNILTLLMLIMTVSCYHKSDKSKPRQANVGTILFDPKQDDASFQPCHEDLILEYYNFGNPYIYQGEKAAIAREFNDIKIPESNTGKDGYVIIRFMVNCEGRTGRFRVEQLNFNYEAMQFDDKLINSILYTTKQLDGWLPAIHEHKSMDYYRYLTFKIINNQIIDILP